MKRNEKKPLSAQMKAKVTAPKVKRENKPDGNFSTIVSTGSTLLDLAISGRVVRGGGIPGGVLVEIFGPSSTGKTVLLCEIAGGIQRLGGDVLFNDPEARLNKQFARMFALNTDNMDYTKPNTVTEVFEGIRAWEPKGTKINGIFTDSLAALSTDMEMEKKEGDKMGMRRAKEFSEETRKTCRILAQQNYIMVCSNQVRQNAEASFGQKYTTPGGEAIGFYASVRLRTSFGFPQRYVKKKITIKGKEVNKIIGVKTDIEVFKNSVSSPYRTAPVTIIFDYGIDDIRENLQYYKDFTKSTVYMCGATKLAQSMEDSIRIIEGEGLEQDLKNAVIDLWMEVDKKFDSDRKLKSRL